MSLFISLSLFGPDVFTATSSFQQGEMSFEQDCLVEGGCLGEMHNGTEYREVRQFQSAHHLVRFYFVTRIYSRYMQSILEDFRNGLKPDVVIVNSCIWDISRWDVAKKSPIIALAVLITLQFIWYSYIQIPFCFLFITKFSKQLIFHRFTVPTDVTAFSL